MKLRSFPISTYILGIAMFAAGCGAASKLSTTPVGQKYLTKIAMWQTLGGGSLYRTSGLPTAKAQTAGFAMFQSAVEPVAIAMSFNGFCTTSDYVGLSPANGTERMIAGFGAVGPYCLETPATMAANFGEGNFVIGSGALSTLRVYSQTSNGVDAIKSGVVRVYVNGVATALTCALGTGKRCADDTDIAAVNDNDVVTATITLAPGDGVLGQLKVMLGKQ